MNRPRMSGVRAWLVSGLLLLLSPLHAAQAATVSIESLLIDAASLTLAITGARTTNYSYSRDISPPIEIVMGTYQDPIVGMSNGFLTAAIYSSGLYGAPPPNGSVDTVAGTINVDFSSFRLSAMTLYGSLDVSVPVITNPASAGTYDTSTGAYFLYWSNPFSVVVSGQTITGTATIGLAGTATLVPIPAALWLLGSGLIGLVGVARRRRTGAS